MDIVIAPPVQLTSEAVKEVRRLMSSDPANKFLRVGIKGGGCSGLSYLLGFDELQENDEQYNYEGIPLIMNKAHGLYLAGMEIDWQNGLNARGFTFTNPNASKTCGCGTSFAV